MSKGTIVVANDGDEIYLVFVDRPRFPDPPIGSTADILAAYDTAKRKLRYGPYRSWFTRYTAPKRQHATYDEAMTEAQRLADLTGFRTIVLALKGCAQPAPVVWINGELREAEAYAALLEVVQQGNKAVQALRLKAPPKQQKQSKQQQPPLVAAKAASEPRRWRAGAL